MQIATYNFPDDLYYDDKHSWARIEGDIATVGLTDFSQQLAGAFIHINLPKKGKTVAQGKPLAAVESGKWVGRAYAPVSGEVIEVNEGLKKQTGLMNSDPYGEGWIARIKMSNPAETANLLQGEALKAFIEEEIAKHQK
ncbi:glycine cleavage system protein GcvH [Moorella sp. Hama-1]|uniref:glycine cleavage system protein GcvH n=1 Tax=Moorella sp. Hama-1 TaxID=2138101 RepID=UPI000D650C91|nr:glycine cleavage system protein GcvH [Moorella sp. Hama-1]MDN5362596.1 glycine cleavage system protein [Moorella sp. (in: firmicutes)]BCV20256.1 glycine cleavage system H protein [Moorella sp. Hama-1]